MTRVMMKLSKGCKVEVLCKEEFSWRIGEIVSVSRSSCLIRYDPHPGTSDAMAVEKVSRKVVRPLPPPVVTVDGFDVGDLVEVFDKGSWKVGTVLIVTNRNDYKVRLLGSCKEITAGRCRIRVRQSWQGQGWAVLRKGFGSSESGKARHMPSFGSFQKPSHEDLPADSRVKFFREGGCVRGFEESHAVSCRTLKRASPYFSSQVEGYNGRVFKRKSTCNENEYSRLVSFQESAELEKVDDVAYPREFLGQNYSLSNKVSRYYEKGKEEYNGFDLLLNHNHSEPTDYDSDASVGSCSINGDRRSKLQTRNLAGPTNDAACSSDAESCNNCGSEEEEGLTPLEDVATRIHRLEFHAYRNTLAALYASGSISWEQEALLTNLRLWLHISNEEHLIELKNLISAGVHLR